jgi:translation initiation factor 2 beta subunit (eIF-2beta)/eIF-5
MRKLTEQEIEMMLAQAFVLCPVCGEVDTLVAKPFASEDRFCGFCEDCVDVCDFVGLGDTEEEAIQDFVEKNLK